MSHRVRKTLQAATLTILTDSPLANTWCRPPDSELDLQFSTFGGKPLDFQDVLWAVGVLREVISDEIKAHGRNGRCEEKSLRVVTRGIVLTIFDERLKEHTWGEVYDLLDVLLVCVYVDKIGSEMHGMFFQIANWHRVAAFMISSAAEPGPPAGGIATS